MQKSLFQKAIWVILLIILTVLFVPSFYFLNKSVRDTIVKFTDKTINNDIQFINNSLRLKSENGKIDKKKLSKLFKEHFIDSHKILFIYDLKKSMSVSKSKLKDDDMQKLVKINPKNITIDLNHYAVKSINFEPLSWKIYYLYNLKDQNRAILNNQIVIIITILVLIFTIFCAVLILFKKYLKNADNNTAYINNILNTQTSIIITKNVHEEITNTNNIFFQYFHMFKDLDDFKRHHSTITDFFVEEKGFIYKFNDKSWIDEILNDSKSTHRVKLDIYGSIYFFTIDLVKSKQYGHTLITLTDITNLENQKALLEQYDKIINKSLMVSRTDLDGKILYANDELLKATKYSQDELIGQNESILRSPNTPEKFYKDMQKIVHQEKIWSGQLEKIDKNKEIFYVHLYLSPIVDASHNITGYMYLRHNITELITAQQKAKDAEQSKSIFLASMSHEIRTPLNAIIGFTKILSKSNMEEKFKHYVKTIDKSAESLLSILNNILDISKIQSNNLVLEKTEFNPFEEFNSTVNLFYAKFRDKQINVECFIDPKIPQTIVGDSLRIKQVLSNLISNAIKFTKEKGLISIRADLINKNDKSCEINFSIKDSGVGIPKDKQAAIFNPFEQASNSTTRVYGGTGLGLDICSKIVKLHDSKIELKSEVGLGSKFSFTIKFNIKDDKDITSLIENLKTCIVKFPSHQIQYNNLKKYINSITKNIIINDTNNIELLKQQDIVFISEESIDKRIQKLAQDGVKFAIFSTDLSNNFNVTNSYLLSSPINISEIFNILIERLKGNTPIKKDNKDNLKKYKGSVLIAEDHEVNQELISILLDMRGLKYTLANDGEEVVEKFKKGNFDLVLMDINMPKQNGIEATVLIRKYELEKNLKQVPIVSLTANALEENRQQIIQSGMNAHLLKPIDEEKLDDVLTKFLKEHDNLNTKTNQNTKTNLTNNNNENYTIQKASNDIGIAIDSLSKIVKNFGKNIDKDMNKLQLAIDSSDFKNIKNISHKIKGATLNLKMNKAGNLALKLENTQNKDIKYIEDIFNKLVKEINFLKNYINSL